MDFNKMMKQAEQMQKEMQKAQVELQAKQFTGSANNGLVKVTINGDTQLKSVELDDSIVNVEDKEMLQDMICLAVNDAIKNLDNAKVEMMSKVTSGLEMPGLR